jgi:TolB-like protein/DNA-binding winged helix-turn-helix (wHTH) protein/Tfp pilus assembly protein PilF
VQDTVNYRFADLTLDAARRSVTRNGEPIELKALDFDLLRFLVEAAPNVVNADVLAEKVWGRHFVSPENVAQRVMLLRQSLSDDANRPRYIETIRNKGYRLIPLVERMAATENRAASLHRRWLVPAAALLALAVIAAAVYWSGPHVARDASVDETRPRPNSIAVLPFANLSSDPEQAYFADGLSQELLDKLIKIEPLSVTAYSSSVASKASTGDVATIGRQLGVGHVLEGSVRKAGNEVRITAQLVDTATGFHVWSETYDGELADVFGLQDEISRRVAEALQVTLGIGQPEFRAGGTQDMHAYEHYLLARSLLRQGSQEQRVRAELEQALALDPQFGLAQTTLAQILIRLASNAKQVGDFADERDRAIDRAIAIAPALPETSWLRAHRFMMRREWLAAENAVKEMWARSSPNDYAANANYGDFLRRVGYATESLPYLERARLLDPLVVKPYVNLGFAYDALGDYERAVETYDEMRAHVATLISNDVMPQFLRVLARGDLVTARQVIEENCRVFFGAEAARAPRCEDAVGDDSLFYLLDEDRGLAKVRASHARTPADSSFGLAVDGLYLARFGDADLAAEAFGKALLLDQLWLQFAWIPVMEPARRHPRFKEVLTELKLVDYWRATRWPERCRPLGERDFECF